MLKNSFTVWAVGDVAQSICQNSKGQVGSQRSVLTFINTKQNKTKVTAQSDGVPSKELELCGSLVCHMKEIWIFPYLGWDMTLVFSKLIIF